MTVEQLPINDRLGIRRTVTHAYNDGVGRTGLSIGQEKLGHIAAEVRRFADTHGEKRQDPGIHVNRMVGFAEWRDIRQSEKTSALVRGIIDAVHGNSRLFRPTRGSDAGWFPNAFSALLFEQGDRIDPIQPPQHGFERQSPAVLDFILQIQGSMFLRAWPDGFENQHPKRYRLKPGSLAVIRKDSLDANRPAVPIELTAPQKPGIALVMSTSYAELEAHHGLDAEVAVEVSR